MYRRLLVSLLGLFAACNSMSNSGEPCMDSSSCGAGQSCVNSICIPDNNMDMAQPPADMAVAPLLPLCSSGGWCWQNPLPQGNNLRSVWASGPSSAWAVGEGGTIIYYNGIGWTQQSVATSQTLNGVWGTSATNVYAVGTGGRVYHFDGTSWSSMATGISMAHSLRAVWGADATNIWAVGADLSTNGFVYKLNTGTMSWAVQTVPVGTEALNGVYAPDPTHIYAVGINGTILFSSDGATFVRQTAATNCNFMAVSGYDNMHVFAVGTFNTSMNINYTANGGTNWAAQNSNIVTLGGSPLLSAVWAGDATHVYAFGPGGLVDFYDGNTWTVQSPAITTSNLIGSFGTSLTNVMAVGDLGTIIRNNGTQYSLQSSSVGTAALRDVFAADPTHAWAVGAAGTILAWNGTTWSAQTSGVNVTLNGVWGSDANTVWAVGDRPAAGSVNPIILKTTNGGGQWTVQANSLAGQNLLSITGSDAMRLWAVGTAGNILNTTNGGTAWAAQGSGVAANLNGVFAADANTVWAVGGLTGGNATILKTTDGGTNWGAQGSGVTQALFGIFGLNNMTLWAVGGGGTIITTANGGTTWTTQPSGLGSTIILNSVWGSSSSDVYAVGVIGSIVHYDGNAWAVQPSGTAQTAQNTLIGVHGSDATHKWAVGQSGIILSHN